MIKHIWSVLTQKTIIEQSTNSMSLIDVLEEINIGLANDMPEDKAPSNINIPIAYEVVTYLRSDIIDPIPKASIRINLINPKGKILNKFEHELDWEKGKHRLRVKTRILGLSVDMAGEYIYEISLKEDSEDYKVISELPLQINISNKEASKTA